MIRLDDVSFSRGTRPIIDHMSVFIAQHERVAVLGGSGAGKTTLLKLITRLIAPQAGRIEIDGLDVTELPERQLRQTRMKFSITFQDGALFDSLSVRENVAFFMREYGKFSEGQIEQRVRALLARVAMEPAIDLMPEELSGGMKRRVAIARSLALSTPRMFLYDEPTSDLDPINAAIIRTLILDLASQGRGFIIVTHEINDAFKLAGRFLFLSQGAVLFDGDRRAFENAPHEVIQTFIRESQLNDV
jgi:phospholipid/cholesterol/gamma-HCH transport system ATP-binding protein